MKRIVPALLLPVLILSACQKEPSFEDPNSIPGSGGSGTSTTGLLVRAVQASSADSSVSIYTYDAAKRLVFMDVADSQSSYTSRIVRNASGIIIQYILKSPQFASLGIDSLATNVFYDNALSRYTYMKFDLNIGGVPLSDSAVFTYDGTGNITSRTEYSKTLIGGYQPAGRTDFTYAGGNVSSEKNYDYSGSYTLSSTTTYTYDAKLNPLILGKEAIVIGLTSMYGPNNATGVNFVDATDPANNTTQTSAYTYNALNKPSGGSSVANPGASNYTLRFYYN